MRSDPSPELDQGRAPIAEMIAAFQKKNRGYFNIPAHRGARFADASLTQLLGEAALLADLTETDGTDDLHAPTGAIRVAEELAADLFGSDACFFLVNGASCGVQAMLYAALCEGEKVLIGRNAHASAHSGLILSGAEPVWYLPDADGITRPETIRAMLAADPSIRAVYLTSPTYEGRASDVRAIAECCHAAGVPLLVDESHGGHYYFHALLPEGAITCGADLVTISAHKTIGSLTQSAMLHRCGDRIDPAWVKNACAMFQSTSPSYLLMASLDAARHQMAVDGHALLAQAIELAEQLRASLDNVRGIRVAPCRRDGARYLDDPTRVVFSGADVGLTGYALQAGLFARGITTERADVRDVLAILTPGNAEADIRLLADAVQELLSDATGQSVRDPGDGCATNGRPAKEMPDVPAPVVRILPRALRQYPTEQVPVAQCAGRIAAEFVTPYPPGIPLVAPGEEITETILAYLFRHREAGAAFHGPSDENLETICCIAQTGKGAER